MKKNKVQPPIKKAPLSKETTKKETFLKDVVLSYKIPKMVKILWVDAYTIGGAEWLEKDESRTAAREPLPHMITLGFVLFSDNEQVAVTNTIGPSETAQINKIPKRMIINMETLH